LFIARQRKGKGEMQGESFCRPSRASAGTPKKGYGLSINPGRKEGSGRKKTVMTAAENWRREGRRAQTTKKKAYLERTREENSQGDH